MPKTLTHWNRVHPVMLFNEFKAEVKSTYRKLSNDELDHQVSLASEGAQSFDRRKDKLSYLQQQAEEKYKADWKEKYGWDFNDAYNDAKLRMHLNAMKKEAAQKEWDRVQELVEKGYSEEEAKDIVKNERENS